MSLRPPTSTRRVLQLRRRAARRMLGEGAIAGLVVGIGAQVLVDGSLAGTDELLVRGALMLPAIVFLAWWLVSPGVRQMDAEAAAGARAASDSTRLDQVEHVFDAAAVPRAHRERPSRASSDAIRAELASSIRRDGGTPDVDPASFGVPRPPGSIDERSTGA